MFQFINEYDFLIVEPLSRSAYKRNDFENNTMSIFILYAQFTVTEFFGTWSTYNISVIYW